jgi:hypothetical protein
MKALINPQQNNLIVQVEDDNKTFEVASPLHWIDCSNDIIAHKYEYINNDFVLLPEAQTTAEENKKTAIDLLSQTDWTTISDVADSALSNPYLANQAEFITFRNEVRQIAINPIDGNLDWKSIPNAVWQSV